MEKRSCESCYYWCDEPGDVVSVCDCEHSAQYGWRMLCTESCDEWSGRGVDTLDVDGYHEVTI